MTVNTTKSVHYIMTRGAGEWRRYSVNAIKIPPFIIYDARNTMPIDTPVYVVAFPDSKLELGRFFSETKAMEIAAQLSMWEGVNWSALPLQSSRESDSEYLHRALTTMIPNQKTQRAIRDYILRQARAQPS